jgi:hypothetical protein
LAQGRRDAVISARFANVIAAQQGAIHRDQILAAGWTDSHIKTRLRRGEWRRVHLAVYIAGDPELLPLARHSAALLSLGPHAALGDRTGVELWGLIRQDKNAPIHVTLPAKSARPRRGVRIHLVKAIDPRDIRTREHLKVTSPARSLIDFAAEAPSNELLHAIGEAVAHDLTSESELRQALQRVPTNHAGAKIVRGILADEPDLIRARSRAERIALPLIIAADLPRPEVNVWLHGELVDLYWPEQGLIVEVDGYQFHKGRLAFETDRRRDAKLIALGYRVIRITWPQLTHQSHMVIARIAQALTLVRAA